MGFAGDGNDFTVLSDQTSEIDKIDAYFSSVIKRVSEFTSRSSSDVLKDFISSYRGRSSSEGDATDKVDCFLRSMYTDSGDFGQMVDDMFRKIDLQQYNNDKLNLAYKTVLDNYWRGLAEDHGDLSFSNQLSEETAEFCISEDYFDKKIKSLDRFLKPRQSMEFSGAVSHTKPVKTEPKKMKRSIDVDISASLQSIFATPKRQAVLLDNSQNLKLAQKEATGKRTSCSVSSKDAKQESSHVYSENYDDTLKPMERTLAEPVANLISPTKSNYNMNYPVLNPITPYVNLSKANNLQTGEYSDRKSTVVPMEHMGIPVSMQDAPQDQAKMIESVKDILSKVSVSDRKHIVNFLCGQRNIPEEAGDSHVYDILVESKVELIGDGAMELSEYVVETIFRMDYDSGEWKKIKLGRKKIN